MSVSNQCKPVINKRKRTPKGPSKKENPEKLATQSSQDEEKQNKNTTQYVMDTTIRKQTQSTWNSERKDP